MQMEGKVVPVMQKNVQNQADIPTRPLRLMSKVYREVLPAIHKRLAYWKQRAEQIPNEELRRQALASIAGKQFHCEGGGIYALLAPLSKRDDVYDFIVAYQTISDYLDNLCDRSISVDGHNFRQLHRSMQDAIIGSRSTDNYYLYQEDQEDGGYLLELVQVCQQSLAKLPGLTNLQQAMLKLCSLYCDLQVYKHIVVEKRLEALIDWWREYQYDYPDLAWYEFAAATGSTLGIFYFTALAAQNQSTVNYRAIASKPPAYFPYVQGLHILLDYLIDQAEDIEGKDLNFCFYYQNEAVKRERLTYIYQQARTQVSALPEAAFHLMVMDGLLGMYLADKKVTQQKTVRQIAKQLLKLGTWQSRFFYMNCWWIHRLGAKV